MGFPGFKVSRFLGCLLVACGSSSKGDDGGTGDATVTGDGSTQGDASGGDGSSGNGCYRSGSGSGGAIDTDCCFGFQCKSAACCRAGGAICNSPNECCGGSCTSGTGAGKLSGTCNTDFDCCEGTACNGGNCCRRGGAVCQKAADCCNGNCDTNGTCACAPPAGTCKSTLDCCAGFQCRASKCCAIGGAVCNTPSACCSGSCTNGLCDCLK